MSAEWTRVPFSFRVAGLRGPVTPTELRDQPRWIITRYFRKQKLHNMTASLSIAAQSAHPSILPVLDGTHSSESETRLDRIRRGAPVASVYRDESRSWWDLVDNDRVWEFISREDFQAYVRLVAATA